MYLPRSFEETDRDTMLRFIRSHPLATLVTMSADGFCADHVPLLVAESPHDKTVLRGHVARANPVWKNIGECADVLAVFHDPGGYITPSWYATKAETGKAVPTWNYVAVHATGKARAIHDHDWLHALLGELTAHHEATRSAPWSLSDAPKDYVDAQIRAIVGIEVRTLDLKGKWKMSQNRLPRDIDGVVEGLRCEASEAARQMAEEVERRRPPR